ncbi:molecular chaperone (plasmid) [Morganella morganii]|uniref:fimbrial biogenesis chaperone n=1 Tax=Morganella morganii TaxID=582 RepID=UPI000D96314C|nr:molecular chaperone [Morganella morganii]WNP32659.1 molecular chaperone [Morganella morganii]SPX81868.1 Chaperone protein fimC precursor [Morganella morganii]
MRFMTISVSLLTGFLLLFSGISGVSAAGVGINTTRVVIHQGSPAVSVTLRNSTENNTYLVQSYITNDEDSRQPDNSPFDVLPPVFQLAPGSQGDVRLAEKAGSVARLPADRESVFWFHARAIPRNDRKPAQEYAENHGAVKIALENVIKVFYRPANLPMTAEQAQAGLRFAIVAEGLSVTNPSPYHVTLAGVTVASQPVKLSRQDAMLAPFSEHTYQTRVKTGEVSWTTINDLGGYNTHHAQL